MTLIKELCSAQEKQVIGLQLESCKMTRRDGLSTHPIQISSSRSSGMSPHCGLFLHKISILFTEVTKYYS